MKKKDSHLVSPSTILILSGFLVGITIGRIVGSELSPLVLSSGLAGFVAYLALDVAATRRMENRVHEEIQHMEERLDKHVLSLSSVAFKLPPREPKLKPEPKPDREDEPSLAST